MTFLERVQLTVGGVVTFAAASLGVTGVYNSVSARSTLNACAQQTIETPACDASQVSAYSRQAEITTAEMLHVGSVGGVGVGMMMVGAAGIGRRRRQG